MKKIKHVFLAAALSCLAQFVQAQTAPAILWQKSLGGSGGDEANSIQQTADGGYIVAGSSISTDGDVTRNHGSYDFWVVKLNSHGDTVWQKSMGGTGLDAAKSISQTADGGYIVAGLTWSYDGDVIGNHGSGDLDYWVVKLSSTGGIQWQKCLGGSNDDMGYSIQQTRDGGYIVAGVSNSTDGDAKGNQITDHDYWVVKLNGIGGIQWQKNMGVNVGIGRPPSMQQTADGGYIVAGGVDVSDPATAGAYPNYNYFVGKLNSAGAIEWKKTFGGTFEDYAASIRQTADGGYIVAGNSKSYDGDVLNGAAGDFCWLLKLTSYGGIEWQNSLLDGRSPQSIQQTLDRGYVVAGSPGGYSTAGGAGGYWVAKLDTTGGIQWRKRFGGSNDDFAQSIQQTADSGYIVAGSSRSTDGDVTGNHGDLDYWVVKLGGTLTTTPNITIATQGGGALCANTAVVFTAALENAGTSPAYQWQKNGVNVGTNSKTYSIAKLNAGDSVTCVLTVAGTAYKSNTLTASPIVKPAVSISSTATGGIACAGTAVVFTATATNGGTTPTYQWLKNSIGVGGSSASYTDNSLTTGDTIKVTLTSNAACPSPNATTTSKGLGFKVNAVINRSIEISDISHSLCAGEDRSFQAGFKDSLASYQWYKNNVKVGKNAFIYSDKKLKNNDSIWYVFTTKTVCATPSTAKSRVVVVEVTPLPTATISGAACMGSTLTLNINSDIPVRKIAWERNGVPVANYRHAGYNNINGTTVATGPLSEPRGICTDNDGNLYIADAGNSRVQKWIPGSTQAITVAGGHGQGGADNQTDYPIGVFVDGDGSLYVADASNHRVQKWAPGASQGVTVAGGNGQGSAANQLNSPWGVYVAPTGEIYVADAGNHRVQKWTPGEGFGVTVAGGGGMGAGDYQLDSPSSVLLDERGFLYVADAGNNRVQRFNRRVNASLDSTRGVTVAGLNAYGLGNLSYAAVLDHPYGICTDGIGGIFVADSYNQRVQNWPTNAQTIDNLPITEAFTVAGSDIGIGGSAANQLSYPYGVCFVNKHTDWRGIYGISYATIGSLYITDYANNRVQLYELTDSTNRGYTADSAGTYHAVVTSLGADGRDACTATTKDFVVKPTISLGATVTTNVTSPICAGTKVAFTAAPVDASAKPHYQWYKNTVAVGKNSAVYTDATLKDLDGISVMLTSKAACATPDTVVTDVTVFNVNPLPAATSAIAGPAKVTANAAGVVFSVNNIPGANYVWGVPSGCSIVAGNGTNSITVTWGTVGGKISVQTTNGCGLSKPVFKTVSVVATMANIIGSNSIVPDNAEKATTSAFLYPNPAATASKLLLSGFAGSVTVTVTTMAGKVVWEQDKLTNGTYTLPLANLGQGMYLVSIKDKASMRTLKLIKVK